MATSRNRTSKAKQNGLVASEITLSSMQRRALVSAIQEMQALQERANALRQETDSIMVEMGLDPKVSYRITEAGVIAENPPQAVPAET
jgi:hypothetical protein